MWTWYDRFPTPEQFSNPNYPFNHFVPLLESDEIEGEMTVQELFLDARRDHHDDMGRRGFLRRKVIPIELSQEENSKAKEEQLPTVVQGQRSDALPKVKVIKAEPSAVKQEDHEKAFAEEIPNEAFDDFFEHSNDQEADIKEASIVFEDEVENFDDDEAENFGEEANYGAAESAGVHFAEGQGSDTQDDLLAEYEKMLKEEEAYYEEVARGYAQDEEISSAQSNAAQHEELGDTQHQDDSEGQSGAAKVEIVTPQRDPRHYPLPQKKMIRGRNIFPWFLDRNKQPPEDFENIPPVVIGNEIFILNDTRRDLERKREKELNKHNKRKSERQERQESHPDLCGAYDGYVEGKYYYYVQGNKFKLLGQNAKGLENPLAQDKDKLVVLWFYHRHSAMDPNFRRWDSKVIQAPFNLQRMLHKTIVQYEGLCPRGRPHGNVLEPHLHGAFARQDPKVSKCIDEEVKVKKPSVVAQELKAAGIHFRNINSIKYARRKFLKQSGKGNLDTASDFFIVREMQTDDTYSGFIRYVAQRCKEELPHVILFSDDQLTLLARALKHPLNVVLSVDRCYNIMGTFVHTYRVSQS